MCKSGQVAATPFTRYSPETDRLSGEVIEAAVEVRLIMKHGLLERIYERCLVKRVDEISRLVPTMETSLEQKETKATKGERPA